MNLTKCSSHSALLSQLFGGVILFLNFTDGEEGFQFGRFGTESLLFADDVVLLASSDADLQLR